MEGKEIIENMSKGDVKYHYFSNVKIRYRYLISVSGTNVCKIGRDDNDNSTQEKANALLICDAFNVANQTGLTPSQLQSDLEKAKEFLSECSRFLNSVQAPVTPAIYLKQEITTFLENSGLNKNLK